MISAFGVDHGSTISKWEMPGGLKRLGTAYQKGRSQELAAHGVRNPALRTKRLKTQGAFGYGKAGNVAERTARHVGFHRNAYIAGGAGTAGAGVIGGGAIAARRRDGS